MKKLISVLFISALLAGCSSDPSKNATQLSASARTKSARINIQLGMAYLQSQQNDLAKTKLLKAMSLAPNLPEANYAFGYYYLEVKEPKKAEPFYKRALKLAPNNPNVLNSYGVFLCAIGQYDNAEKAFLNAASVPSFTAVGLTYQNAGDCAYKYKDDIKAMVYFKKANQIDPRLPVPLLRLAEIDFANGKMKTAQQYLNGFNELADPNKESLKLAIKLAEFQGQKSKAASLRLQLNAMQPNQPSR